MSHVVAKYVQHAPTSTLLFKLIIGVAYPVTIIASLYYACASRSPSKNNTFHHKKTPINIATKSMNVQKNRQNIEKQILNIYNLRPNHRTEEVYAADATFEDPLIFCKGVKPITCLIHGLPIFCTEMKVILNIYSYI